MRCVESLASHRGAAAVRLWFARRALEQLTTGPRPSLSISSQHAH